MKAKWAIAVLALSGGSAVCTAAQGHAHVRRKAPVIRLRFTPAGTGLAWNVLTAGRFAFVIHSTMPFPARPRGPSTGAR